MSDSTLGSQSLEIVSLWEDAVCLHSRPKALPADWLRAKKRLARVSAEKGARHYADHPLAFYRVSVILTRRNGSMTMSELSDALGTPLSTTTRLVGRLAAGGFLVRATDPTDHRIVRLTLTAEGYRLYKTIHDFAQQRVEAALRHFTSRERKELIALLRKVVVVLADLPV